MYNILIVQLKKAFFLPRMPQHQRRQFVVHEPRARKMQFRSSVCSTFKQSQFVCLFVFGQIVIAFTSF